MPSVSEPQHRAMEAAAHGNSTLGIPEKVGKEFVAADINAKLDALIDSADKLERACADAMKPKRELFKSTPGEYAAGGNLKEFGFKPEVKILPSDHSNAAKHAWNLAFKSGKDVTITRTVAGWGLGKKKDAKFSNAPHTVVTPQGDLRIYVVK